MQSIKKYGFNYHISAPRSPNYNSAEADIPEINCIWFSIIQKKKVPPILWDYGSVWVFKTGNIFSTGYKYSDGKTPLEMVKGETPNTSE